MAGQVKVKGTFLHRYQTGEFLLSSFYYLNVGLLFGQGSSLGARRQIVLLRLLLFCEVTLIALLILLMVNYLLMTHEDNFCFFKPEDSWLAKVILTEV